MSNAPVDNGRRRFLTVATSVVGGAGVVGAAVPFIASWNPSEKAKAAGAPVEVNISKIATGQLVRTNYRGKPIYIVRRGQDVIDALGGHEDQLSDPQSNEAQQPEYAQNQYRSINPEYLVAEGVCTHLGCAPSYQKGDFAEQVEGVDYGFFCPCHGSKFDMAGRVFSGVPAPLNLVVPEHSFLDDNTLIIGVGKGDA
ncbi:ubiquinol-cytochrome c reductase iron-sulfur subunit [Thalassotalea sp. PS06]|uniref:ubiquinol-cytochrome c reductase iron-sulfur subunit n=1 Tax=Thalassotalea sp. PS06 TaxID=2594005 RepID=UPI00116534E3|nr:ubiquinol-cytochrome c reductase iron-sulfur subunit [Thalassotalea sp. PS06]QDP00323.1 ubiquinol-cytochrome c reductase iron-sulfur subunit [Thalassotalea sp. PS06]